MWIITILLWDEISLGLFDEEWLDEVDGWEVLESILCVVNVDLGDVEESLLLVFSKKWWSPRQHHVGQDPYAPWFARHSILNDLLPLKEMEPSSSLSHKHIGWDFTHLTTCQLLCWLVHNLESLGLQTRETVNILAKARRVIIKLFESKCICMFNKNTIKRGFHSPTYSGVPMISLSSWFWHSLLERPKSTIFISPRGQALVSRIFWGWEEGQDHSMGQWMRNIEPVFPLFILSWCYGELFNLTFLSKMFKCNAKWRSTFFFFFIKKISQMSQIQPHTLRSRWTMLFLCRKATPSRICLINHLTSSWLKASSLSATHWLKTSPPAALWTQTHSRVRVVHWNDGKCPRGHCSEKDEQDTNSLYIINTYSAIHNSNWRIEFIQQYGLSKIKNKLKTVFLKWETNFKFTQKCL